MRIFIAGHRGMAGSAIRRHLEALGGHELIVRTLLHDFTTGGWIVPGLTEDDNFVCVSHRRQAMRDDDIRSRTIRNQSIQGRLNETFVLGI